MLGGKALKPRPANLKPKIEMLDEKPKPETEIAGDQPSNCERTCLLVIFSSLVIGGWLLPERYCIDFRPMGGAYLPIALGAAGIVVVVA